LSSSQTFVLAPIATPRSKPNIRTVFLKSLEPQDRLILQFQFEDDMHISDIARRLQVDQKPLYRRREQLFRELRSALEKEGIGADEIHDLLDHPDDE